MAKSVYVVLSEMQPPDVNSNSDGWTVEALQYVNMEDCCVIYGGRWQKHFAVVKDISDGKFYRGLQNGTDLKS